MLPDHNSVLVVIISQKTRSLLIKNRKTKNHSMLVGCLRDREVKGECCEKTSALIICFQACFNLERVSINA